MRDLAACLVAACLLAACPGRGRAPAPRRTPWFGSGLNVLLVTIDTLRADHLGSYGYVRNTSPRIDALAKEGVVFDRAYTFWPKTRGSMAIMLTGRRPSQNGYGKTHQVLLDFNPTLASTLKGAGYVTAAIVDNPNVAAQNGYAKGFDTYRETWEESQLATEMDRAKAITEGAVRFLRDAGGTLGALKDRPFFLWLHYVNPHAPYTPPPPFDTAFLDGESRSGPRLPVVPGYHGGIPKQWKVAGKDRLGYYVAQYDGEIATVDREVGEVADALRSSGAWDRTVVVITSDHGESLGEHDYYFDHGEDLFDPSLRIPLVVLMPGARRGARSDVLASTLDIVPTILDAVQVSYPAGLAGESLLGAVTRARAPERARLFAQNERNLVAAWDARFKLVGRPEGEGLRYALYDRSSDPAEMRDVAGARPGDLRPARAALEQFLERTDREWASTRRLLAPAGEKRGQEKKKLSREACEKLKSLGYLVAECEP